MKYLAKFLLVGWLAVGIASSCPALIINGAANATAPTSDPGWSNVGTLGGASCVYLGNGWVLTAGHVGEGTVNLNGTAYNADPNITPVGFSSSPGSTTSAGSGNVPLADDSGGVGYAQPYRSGTESVYRPRRLRPSLTGWAARRPTPHGGTAVGKSKQGRRPITATTGAVAAPNAGAQTTFRGPHCSTIATESRLAWRRNSTLVAGRMSFRRPPGIPAERCLPRSTARGSLPVSSWPLVRSTASLPTPLSTVTARIVLI